MKNQNSCQSNHQNNKIEAFSFGEPVPMLDRAEILDYLQSTIYNQKYYNPPLELGGLAKSYRAASHHASAIQVKKNILLSTCVLDKRLSKTELSKFVLDYLVFGNAYFELIKNPFGDVIKITAPKAKYVRKGVEDGKFFYVPQGILNEYEFQPHFVFHLFEPDVNQDVYGIPEYLAAMQSAWLNESATLFRRKYYLNGAHAGFILYMSDPAHNQEDIDNLREQLKGAKGPGNFKNLFMYSANGKKDGVQVIPLADVAAKDEFLNIKNVSRDDVLAAHRVPPQLMGIIPNNTGGFGDVAKAAEVFFINEIQPLQERLLELNEWLGEDIIQLKEYELLKEKDDNGSDNHRSNSDR